MQVKGSAVTGRKNIKCHFSLDGLANHMFLVLEEFARGYEVYIIHFFTI